MENSEEKRAKLEAQFEVQVKEAVRKEAEEQISQKLKMYLYLIKGVLIGLSIFSFGVISDADFVHTLHDMAFPPEGPNHIAISYESLIELRSDDPRFQSGALSFYTEKNQKIKIYAHFFHRFSGNLEQRRVIISVDNNRISDPILQFTGGFQDITDKLDWDTRFEREENVHQLGFSLDDSQLPNLTDEVSVICVVLVYGRDR